MESTSELTTGRSGYRKPSTVLPLRHSLYRHSDLFLQTQNNRHTAVLYGKCLNWLMKKFLISLNMKHHVVTYQ